LLADGRKEIKDRRFYGELNFLPFYVSEYLKHRYSLLQSTIDRFQLRWSEKKQRVYIPCDFQRPELGGVLRSFSDPPEQPKSLSFLALPGLVGRFTPVSPRQTSVLVVEDPVSAMAAAQEMYCSAYCLYGTVLDATRLYEICANEPEGTNTTITLALDKDATSRAIDYVSRFCRLFNIRVLPLDKDIKDMDKAERRTLWHQKVALWSS
jgi:hypothetical protein